jgi:D-alanine transaminase
MSRIAYVNNQFVPQSQALIAMEDRGYQFADGVYEVAAFIDRRMLDEARHLDRLERSLHEIAIPMPKPRAALSLLLRELIRRNARDSGLIYLQVTRGVSARNHTFPASIKPVLTMNVLPVAIASDAARNVGVKAITAPDLRWKRCDIKSIALLPNILSRQLSAEKNMRETFLYLPDGTITEGTATNVFIVDTSGVLRTHPKNEAILGGITRDVLLEIVRAKNIAFEERAFTRDDMHAAQEIFFTSTSAFLMPVIEIDGKIVGNGTPGAITKKLTELYKAHVAHEVAA